MLRTQHPTDGQTGRIKFFQMADVGFSGARLARLVGKAQGQYVTALEKDGAADKAGLKLGDVILSLDSNKLYSRDDVADFLGVSRPETKVKTGSGRRGLRRLRCCTTTRPGRAGWSRYRVHLRRRRPSSRSRSRPR